MNESCLVTNFAYGTGPYLRTTELAVAFNDELESRGMARMPIVVPWVYGERQRNVMLEEFGALAERNPGEILLDAVLGGLLHSVFYTGARRYDDSLKNWLANGERVSRDAKRHLQGTLDVQTLGGERNRLDGQRIALELNRSPRIRYGVAPSYSTTFGYVADILERAADLPAGTVDVAPALLTAGAAYANVIESDQAAHCMAYPATFSFDASYLDRHQATLVPPITDLPKSRGETLERDGIYVTVTGIEGLERLYREAGELGLELYSNDPHAVPGSIGMLPSVIADPRIRFHFARAGWGSLWLSLYLGVPVVVPSYDPTDDPEIYFNNIALKKLGFGIVYEGQPLGEILAQSEDCRARARTLREEIIAKWGTFNGNNVCAKLFVNSFLSSA